ncbi:MAG: ADP-ribosylglycohydrolase family protein [Alicyclobacillus sp.]|nr:ADP-ribosylglycohydrolase family protein [Alicyclobacillus sp.]
MVSRAERVRGGLWGLLVGDALGVPYEFHAAFQIPAEDQIEMSPPAGYARTYPQLPVGTWSDDGAQALCLLDSLLQAQGFDIQDFAARLVAWMNEGLWAIDGYVFDCGIQTRAAITQLRDGVPPVRAGFVNPNGKGNGALMRVLPLALWHHWTDAELVEMAHLQSVVTHGALTNQVCCALYCLWARRLLNGLEAESGYRDAVQTLRTLYGEASPYREELEHTVRPDDAPRTDGGGYVVHTLNAARIALRETTYEAVVRRAIRFGNDTDTNAAVAGGLAGIRDGVNGIPERWFRAMRGQDLVEPLLTRLLDTQGDERGPLA